MPAPLTYLFMLLALLFPASASAVTPMVAAYYSHTVALKSNGTVVAWGDNFHGQIGNGTKASYLGPVAVPGLTGVVALAAGAGYTLALKGDGTVVAWGRNYGTLGDGTFVNRLTPVAIPGLTGIVALSAGDSHSLALTSDGTVMAWGSNSRGQLGDGTTTDRLSPVAVPGLSGVVAVAAGVQHSVALKSDGTVVTWGANTFGQLGDGTMSDRSTPAVVPGLAGVVAVSATSHTVALKTGGTVMGWGNNGEGQIGDGTITHRLTPVAVPGLDAVVQIAAGQYHTAALRTDGSIAVWGQNFDGELGGGTTILQQTTPVPVPALAQIAAVSTGYAFTATRNSDGTVTTWGRSDTGRLGRAANELAQLSPGPIPGFNLTSTKTDQGIAKPAISPTALSVGATATLSGGSASSGLALSIASATPGVCILSGNTVTAVALGNCIVTLDQAGDPLYHAAQQVTLTLPVKGEQSIGAVVFTSQSLSVGNSAAVSASATSGLPVSFTSATPWICAITDSTITASAAGICTVTARQAGDGNFHPATTTASITVSKGNQTVRFARAPVIGPGGSNSVAARASSGLPVTLSSLTPSVCTILGTSVTALTEDTCTIAAEQPGNENFHAAPQVLLNIAIGKGDQTVAFRSIPRLIPGRTGPVSAFASSGLPVSLTSATPEICTVSGNSVSAQAAGSCLLIADQEGDMNYRPAPSLSQSITVAGAVKVTPQLATGYTHTVALRSDGTVLTSGNNNHGQLGDGTRIERFGFAAVPGLTDVVAVARTDYRSLALKSDGTVWTWGTDGRSFLSQGSLVTSLSPVSVPGVSDVVALAAGDYHTVALRSDGTLLAWGTNDFGQLGDGTNTARPNPVLVPGVTGVVAVWASSYLNVALRYDGTLVTWGITSRTPVAVPDLAQVTAVAEGGTNAALRSDGTVWTVDAIQVGQLGAGALSEVVSLVASAMNTHTAALKSDGTVWTWGFNGGGQLGDGTITTRETPAPVPGVAEVVALATDSHHTLALTSNGTVLAWGPNQYGALGDGSATPRLYAAAVPGVSGVVSVTAGPKHSFALRSDGRLTAWGDNRMGQLGLPGPGFVLSPTTVPEGLFASQTVAFGPVPAIVAGSTGIVSASASSGLMVSFAATTPEICTVSGDVVTGIAPGTCIISARQAGDAEYNAASATQSMTVLPKVDNEKALQLSLLGTGSGSINSSPSGISCTDGTCSASFASGTDVTLYQSASAGSHFAGWGGDCSGTGFCSLTMDENRSVNATFYQAPAARIGGTGYASLNLAYAAAPSTAGLTTTVMALGVQLPECLTASLGKRIIVRGGYNPDFGSRSGLPTILKGPMKIRSGKITVDRLTVGSSGLNL